MEKKKVTYYLKETAQWAVLIVFVITFLTIPIIQCENEKINARLDKLEAASTAAQQPLERHYFKTADSMIIQDFPIGKGHAIILTNKTCHAGDTVWSMYYKIK